MAIARVSPRGELLKANATLLKLLGFDSLTACLQRDFKSEILADPEDWDPWERALAAGRTMNQRLTLRGTTNRRIPLGGDIWAIPSPSGGIDHLLGVFTDATAARQLDAALQHAARAEAISSLTSGIIHDFNNMLTVLVGNLYLVAEGVRDNPTLFEQTKRARDVARRGSDLTRQLLSFAREDPVDSGAINTRQRISNLKPILDHALGSRISLTLAIDSETAHVDANAAQFESVIVNLVINARDAIEANGTIAVKAWNCFLDRERSQTLGIKPGDYVSISVTDDGAGIPEAIQARIFDPFFTTKGKNRGTGLGLSMVRWFVEQLGGALQLSSHHGSGTTITLLLPASCRAAEDSAAMTMPLKMLPTGNESVLILIEDRALSRTVEESLVILGYAAQVNNESVTLSAVTSMSPSDLIIIDFPTNPETVVDDFPKDIRRANPNTPILLISGTELATPKEPNEVRILKKPFSLKELATAVRDLLDRSPNE
jgi:signal transduction histidine kinase